MKKLISLALLLFVCSNGASGFQGLTPKDFVIVDKNHNRLDDRVENAITSICGVDERCKKVAWRYFEGLVKYLTSTSGQDAYDGDKSKSFAAACLAQERPDFVRISFGRHVIPSIDSLYVFVFDSAVPESTAKQILDAHQQATKEIYSYDSPRINYRFDSNDDAKKFIIYNSERPRYIAINPCREK